MKPIKKFKGHQNTSKNFIRSSFGPQEALVIGGSQDGCVYVWDIESENVLQKLEDHDGVVYVAKWNRSMNLLVSCSHDCTVKTWLMVHTRGFDNTLS